MVTFSALKNEKHQDEHAVRILQKKALTEFDDLYRRQVQLMIDQTPDLYKNEEMQTVLTSLLSREILTIESALKAASELKNYKRKFFENGQLGSTEETEFETAIKNIESYK